MLMFAFVAIRSNISITLYIWSIKNRKIRTPTNTVSKKANIGFCSLTTRAKKVAVNPNPTI